MFVSTAGELPIPDLGAFLQWIQEGHAFIGVHAASDTLKSSDAYVEMIGGHFAGHPWTARGEHGFVNHDPTHPVVKMFPERFRWKDEIYQYGPRYNPDNVRVLLSIDMAASTPKILGMYRSHGFVTMVEVASSIQILGITMRRGAMLPFRST